MEETYTKKSNPNSIMEKLPSEMIESVLCRLPIDASLQAKRVCKSWRIFLRSRTDKVGVLLALSFHQDSGKKNQLFYGDHIRGEMNYTYNALDETDTGKSILTFSFIWGILGSCNGLVCSERKIYPCPGGEDFLICNPITREVVCVPKTDRYVREREFDISGFGYCQSTNEYKIVRIYSDYKHYHVQVYTVGGGGWRNKELISFEDLTDTQSIDASPLYRKGIYANGAIHWLHLHHDHTEYYRILAFDLEDENFQFLPLPPRLEEFQDQSYDCFLGPKLLGGNDLYFVDTLYDEHWTDIWTYKRTNTNTTGNDKISWHWIKEFRRIEWEEPFWNDLRLDDPLVITGNDELLLNINMVLYCYDLKTMSMNKLLDCCAIGSNWISVVPHANSRVLLLKDLEDDQDRQ